MVLSLKKGPKAVITWIGVGMFLFGALMCYAGYHSQDNDSEPETFGPGLTIFATLLLLGGIIMFFIGILAKIKN